jgi:D-alanyl-D-alanine carboxypeptidase/D-alanyl-D-alanine-endopeptidase (penicillin-binding protein 4)
MGLAPVLGLAATPTWATRTIFVPRRAYRLDAVRSRSKNASRVRRRYLAVVLALVALVALAAPASTTAGPSTLQQQLARALRVPHIAPARSAAIAVDLTTGTVLYTQNGTRPLAPASNEKLPLTYAALVKLGPAFRFATDVLGEGEQDGTTWLGPLILKGSGDPTLSTADLRVLAAKVRAAGIRRVTGGIIGDESWFDSRRTVAGWKPSFYIGESPPLSALVVDRARVGAYVTRSPALAATTAFRSALRAAGVAVDGAVRLGQADDYSVLVGEVLSAPLASIVRFMDRESDNFAAELLLKQLGAVELEHGTSPAGAAVVMQTLAAAGVPTAGVRIVDGSGLSTLDRLTVESLAGLLKVAWADPVVRPVLLAALPVAGVNGTLERRLRRPPARGRVLAKTGTTREASALSGYVNKRFAFAVLQNGHPVSYWWARVAQDRFAQVLAGQ